MNKSVRVSLWAAALFGGVVFTSCDEDPPLPENKVTFQSSELGLAQAETEITVNIALVRATDAEGAITVQSTAKGVVYGQHFTTDPEAAANGDIVITVPAGATEASFKVKKVANAGFVDTDEIDFTISSVSDVFVLGEEKTLKLSFGEITATSASMIINGGGINANNRVFIDLSANRQTAVSREAWDLAFASAADKFRVYLNASNKMLARVVDKKDLATVTAADTVGFGGQVDLNSVFAALNEDVTPAWVLTSGVWTDTPTDLTKTAIAEISATDDNNLVYIVNRGYNNDNSKRGWMKIRVLRSGSDYTLQYAPIASTAFQTATITKNSTTDRTYVSLADGKAVSVEPVSGSWDFAWTGFTNVIPTGGPGMTAPYYYQDFILTNVEGGVSTFTYTTGEPGTAGVTGVETYDTFVAADLSVITNYSTSQTGIGSTWRTTGGPPPSPAPSITANKFYIVKDGAGNIYKVKFTALVSPNDERGKPEFKFELLTKGA